MHFTFWFAFSSSYAKTQISDFCTVVQQHTEGMVRSITWNLLLFPAVKEFWKSVKKWQSYHHKFGIILFWDTVYMYALQLRLYDMQGGLVSSRAEFTLKLDYLYYH